jgi:hypothetical protein
VEGACQYQGVVIPVVTVIWQAWYSTDRNIIQQWMSKDGVDTSDLVKVWQWFGQKVKWGGIEATKLCQVFHALTQMVDAIKE